MAERTRLITGIAESGVAKDFSSVEIIFAVNQDEPLVCEIRADTLQRIIIHLCELAAYIRNETLTRGEPHSITAILAGDTQVHVSVGGKVILSVRGGNNVIQHFALTPEMAARLRSELRTSDVSSN